LQDTGGGYDWVKSVSTSVVFNLYSIVCLDGF